MNNADQMKILLSMFAAQVPILLVSLVALVVILGRWKEASRASIWALMGFGLSVILCITIPIVQTSVQSWVIQSGDTMASRATIFSGLAIVWSVLRAVSYAFLLVAIFAGRPASQSATSPL